MKERRRQKGQSTKHKESKKYKEGKQIKGRSIKYRGEVPTKPHL